MSTAMKRARTGVLVLACLCFVTLAVITVMPRKAAALQVVPEPRDVATALTRVGLSPEPLAAAGLSVEQVETLVQNAFADLMTSGPVLNAAQEAFADAKKTHHTYLRLVRAGTATQEQVAEAQQAAANYVATQGDLDVALDGIFAAATDDLPGENITLLETMAGNNSWHVGIEFRTVDRSEPDWVALRDALAHERIQLERGEPVSEEVQLLLAQLRADPTVAQARADLDANLDAIALAWQQQIDLGPQ